MEPLISRYNMEALITQHTNVQTNT